MTRFVLEDGTLLDEVPYKYARQFKIGQGVIIAGASYVVVSDVQGDNVSIVTVRFA